MIVATSAWTAARNGTNSTRRKRSGGSSRRGSSRCESTPVSPWPGKCLPQAATPSACSDTRSEEHTSELQSQSNLVCRLLLEKKKKTLKTDRQSDTTI